MPQIPIYRQQTMVGGSRDVDIARPQLSGAEADAGMRLAQTGQQSVSLLMQIQQEEETARKKQEEEDARAQLAAEEPKAQLFIAQEFDRIKREWTPESRPVSDQISEVIDKYRQDATKRITNPRAQELIGVRADEIKTAYSLNGFEFEQQQRTAARVNTYQEGFTAAAQAGVLDPSTFGRSIAVIKAAIEADTQIPASAKATFIRDQVRQAALTVATARAENDPEQVARYTGVLLGIVEPQAAANVNASDIVGEIVKRESGGRMYGASGEVLRGPPIRTSNGGTIHAYGPYQMLESTAKTQAAKVGVEWNPELFYRQRTGDPVKDAEARQYHDLLGQSYIKDQLDEFGGDPVLVAAAHNMGPAATRGWAAGVPYQTQSGKWWYPKGPKDLGAMPEETRKYVQGLGIEEKPVSAPVIDADPNDENGVVFRLLPPEALIQIRNQAVSNLSEQRRQQAEALKIQTDLFKQRIQDIEVAARNGETIQIPTDQELTTFLPPAEAALTKQRLLNLQQMGAGLKALPGLTNDELDGISRMPPPQGVEDRENRQAVHDALVSRAGALVAARKADPGQAAQDTSPQVQQAYSAWANARNDLANAGDTATEDQQSAVLQAQTNYVRTLFAQQRQWGVAKPTLPKAVIERMANDFLTQLDQDPEGAAASIVNLPSMLGNDDAVAQVTSRIGPLGQLALDGVPGLTLAKIRAQQKTKPADQMKLIEGISTADIDREVRNAFSPFFATLAVQGDRETAERYRIAANQLVMDQVIRGESPKKAAESAYNELFADRNAVVGTYRVDTTRYEPDKVDAGLTAILNAFQPDAFQVTPEPGFSLEESQARKLRTVRQKARWINAGDGESVLLMWDQGPVLNRNGVPIRIRFSDAVRSAPVSVPSPTSYREAKGF